MHHANPSDLLTSVKLSGTLREFALGISRIRSVIEIACPLNSPSRIVIGVMTTGSGEGGSTVSRSLARSFARRGQEVLLVLCEPQPVKQDREYIDARPSSAQPVQHSGQPDLELGNHDGVTMYRQYDEPAVDLDRVGESYDIVIVDLPPVTSDPMDRVTHMDAVVVVSEWGRTEVGVLESALDLLEAGRPAVLGYVLNKADRSAERLLRL